MMRGRSSTAPLPPGAIARAADLAPLLDHTVLRPDATDHDAARACEEAMQYRFAGVCVREQHVPSVARRLERTGGIATIAVVDFPRGTSATLARVEEVRRLVSLGANELDIVFPLPTLASRDHAAALRDLAAVVLAADGVTVKVILETGALDAAEKGAACALAIAAGAAFVKTSTGFGPGGATVEDVALLRRLGGRLVGVKASGGIRTTRDALAMVGAGASRIGASASVAIVTGEL